MGGGKSSTSTQSVSIPPEVLARYNAVNARAEDVAKQPFQPYGGQFVAPLTETQQSGIAATSAASQSAQPYYGAATNLTLSGARDVGPLTQQQIGYYQNPAMLATLAPTQAALQQQQGQQLAQQQAEAIRAGAFGGSGANMQRQILRGQQQLGMGQALAPIYQRAYETGLQTAQGQQGVVASDLARRMQAGQQIAAFGTGAQAAGLQGAQAQIGAGTLQQQTQQAQDTAQYQQFLQERGYPFQVAQFLANIAMGTGALSGSTTTTTQPRGFFSNRGGFKTGETARKAYGGGIDPNSMGGAVYEPGAFERGGYATDGRVDPTDINSILSQMRSFQTPMGGVGPYGQAAGAAPHGPSGIVPQQQLHTPKLMTAGSLPKQQPGDFANLSKGFGLADDAIKDLTGKGLKERAGEKLGLRDSPEKIAEAKGEIPMAGVTGKSSGTPTPIARPDASEMPTSGTLWDKFKDALPFEQGGGVMPRGHFAPGGSTVNPYENRDPSESYIEDTLQEEDASKKPEMLKPSGGGGGGKGGGFGDVVNVASKIIPFFLKDGGVVPRQGYQTVGRVSGNEDGGDAEQPVRQYFDYLTKEKGYEPHVAAGILGNAYHESSGLQPKIVGDQGKSIGLFQFHEKGEQPAFRQWATENQRDISDPYAQLDFVHNRLQGPYAKTLEQMRSAADPASSTEFFMRGYERPKEATAALDRRQAYANAIASGEKLPTFKAYTGGEGGFGAAAGQQAIQRATSGESKGLGAGQELGFFDRNKGIILPVLQGIGAMASSKSISPWAAALQGLGAGAKAYGEEETRQAGTSLTDAQTVNQFMDAARKALMANPANPNVLMVLTPRGWMTQGQAQRLGLSTIGAPLPAAAGATALRRQSSQQLGLGPFDVEKVDVTSATTPQVPKVDAISDVIPSFQNKVQPLGVPGAYYDTQARTAAQADAGSSNISAAQSEEVRKDIDRAAREASASKTIMNDLTQNTASLIANPATGSGPFSNPRKSVLSMADYASRLFFGKELPAEFSPSDLEVNKKIASYLAGQQTSSVNQNSLQAFTNALGAAPNSELSPQALAKITALLMVQKSRAERIGEFARVYGEDAEGRLSSNVIRQYDRIHGRQMKEEQDSLADFFVKYPKAALKVAKGEIPYEVAAQKFKDLYGRPDMAYHFQNR